MAEPYNEVDLEVNVALPLSSSMPPPPYEFEPTTNKVKDYSLNPTQTPKTFTSGLRLRNAVKYLALFEIVLGIISVGSAYIDTSHGNGLYAYYGVWFEAPGIWVGILCIITAGFLLWILCNSTSNRCVMMAHFVLLIINTIGSAVLIMFSFEWIYLCLKIMQQRVTDNTLATLLIFNIILFLLSIILFIACITSTVLICYHCNMCCKCYQSKAMMAYRNSFNQSLLQCNHQKLVSVAMNK